MKNIDEASESIKERGNKRSKKKSKINFLNIEKLSNKVISIIEKQWIVRLINNLLSRTGKKLVLLHFKTKICLWIRCLNCKNIITIPEK